jgi:hypothetical protein
VVESDKSGYLCCFCGQPADHGPDFYMLHVAREQGEQVSSQYFAAHRACFVKAVADDEAIRAGPLFEE